MGGAEELDPAKSFAAATIAAIDAAIEGGMEDSGAIEDLLGNFASNLPEGAYRRFVKDVGVMDRPVVTNQDPGYGNDNHPFSERAESTTWQQFFADIDQAIVDSGVGSEELERLDAAYKGSHPHQKREARQNYNRALLPIYRQMLVMGYLPAELAR